MDATIAPGARTSGLREKILLRQRRHLLAAFNAFCQHGGGGSVLNVGRETGQGLKGAAADPGSANGIAASMLDLLNPQERAQIVSFSIQSALHSPLHSGEGAGGRKTSSQRADARQLSFGDAQFDWVLCDGLLEHAGGFVRQFQLLKELNRVARKGVFVTAANRWYPFDFATGLPLLHWLPASSMSGASSKGRQHRQLLGARDLRKLASLLPGKHASDVGHVRLLGPKAHFFLMIRKQANPGV